MHKKVYYKVVRPNLQSAVNSEDDVAKQRQNVQYKVNEWVSAPDNTRLFVFENFRDADNFVLQRKHPENLEIWECAVIGARKGYPCDDSWAIHSFWEHFNSFLKKKKAVCFSEFPEYVHWCMPSILAKKVKLIKKIV